MKTYSILWAAFVNWFDNTGLRFVPPVLFFTLFVFTSVMCYKAVGTARTTVNDIHVIAENIRNPGIVCEECHADLIE